MALLLRIFFHLFDSFLENRRKTDWKIGEEFQNIIFRQPFSMVWKTRYFLTYWDNRCHIKPLGGFERAVLLDVFLKAATLEDNPLYVECHSAHKGCSTVINQVEISTEGGKRIAIGTFSMFLLRPIEEEPQGPRG